MALINKIACKCLEAGIIEKEDLEWFVYGLEKRTITVIAASFFLIVAISLSDLLTAIAYLGSFYLLRVRINGYHAKKASNCLTLSVLIEIFFLICVLPLLTSNLICALNIADFLIIFFFAPYNHPNMHLNQREINACKVSSRIRISLLSALAIVLCTIGKTWGAEGITLGNTMAAMLLIIAKLYKGENKHEKGNKEEQQAA